jgi:hypothetical protein
LMAHIRSSAGLSRSRAREVRPRAEMQRPAPGCR